MIDKHWFAFCAILLSTVNGLFYLRSILFQNIRPHVFSWIIWGLLLLIGAAAQYAGHGGVGVWPTAYSGCMCLIYAALSLKYGEKKITRSDWIAFIGALAAVPLWLITKNPLTAVILVTLIDTVGLYPTFRKSYINPWQENPYSFFFFAVTACLTLLALENYSLVTVLYQAALMCMELSLAFVIFYRRIVLKTKRA